MRLPTYKKADQKRLLTQFIGGSLLVILICTMVTSIGLAIAFIKRENQRAALSLSQVQHFFRFHYGQIAEEMYMRSVDGIRNRVDSIAEEVGNAKYEMRIADENGSCIFEWKEGKSNRECQNPKEFGVFISSREHTPAKTDPSLKFDEATGRYHYMVPLFVGPTLKGFLYVSLSDPYQFYRGGMWGILLSALLPAVLVILCIWLVWLAISRRFFLKPYLKQLEEMKNHEAMARLARRTAHDIRDPVSWILKLTATLTNIDEGDRAMIKGAVLHLQDVANSLLAQGNLWTISPNGKDLASIRRGEMPATDELLSSIVSVVVSEKRLQYKSSRPAIAIESALGSHWFGLFAKIHANELRRALSNLINNAVEAIPLEGRVTIDLFARKDTAVIQIKDNGKGIPPEILPKLGTLGMTHGKSLGNGLGLYFTKVNVESWGGHLEIFSEPGKGTTVEIVLPILETPSWFASQISIPPKTHVTVLDDHPSIHQTWQDRFGKAAFENRDSKPQLEHFDSADAFVKWYRANPTGRESALYLCDYELLGQTRTGLDVIRELGIKDKTILVTSHFGDAEIRTECQRLGIKIIPKDLAPFIPIHIDRKDPAFVNIPQSVPEAECLGGVAT